MLMEVDWDLHAVVRGCTTISSVSSSSSPTITTPAASSVASNCFDLIYQPAVSPGFPTTFGVGQACKISSLPDPIEARNSSEELHELYKPFFPKSQSFTSPSSTLSYFSYTTAPKVAQAQQKQQQQPSKQSGVAHRSKRRKNQLKKVFQVPAEALSSDIWAWRKYGQKPIKGSPYPRGYYRCSSSKGCLARKQVEQNRSEPGMYIVTYTAEHNHPAPTHRNSLAGSTRQKPLTSEAVTASDSDVKLQAKPTSPVTPKVEEEVVPHSTSSESKEEKEDVVDDEEDEFGISHMELTDDFFTGLDEFTSSATTSDCFTDHIPANLSLPSWVTNCPAVAAGSGCLPEKDQMSLCLPYQS